MSGELQIKITPQVVPENDPDRAWFTLFDSLLTDKSQLTTEEKIEAIEIIEPLP